MTRASGGVSLATLGERLRPWLGWCVVSWLVGVAACAVRPLLGWLAWRRLVAAGGAVPAEVARMVSRACRKLGVTRSVRMLASAAVEVPAVSGWLKPVMLVPAALLTALPPAQLEAIIVHELAHVRRGDLAFLLLQTVLETLAFYHPAVWWLSGRLREEREHCCDDLVVATTGGRAAYGRALVAVEELRGGRMAVAVCAADGSLVSRIRRLVTGVEPRGGAWPLPAFAAAAVAGLVVVAGIVGPATADAPPQDAPPQDAPRLERLTAEQARNIVAGLKNDADKAAEKARSGGQGTGAGDVLKLDGPTAIDAEAATVLAAFEGTGLHLDGVTQLDVEAAKALAGFEGGSSKASGGGWLQLNGLTRIDAATARGLAAFVGRGLHLGLTTLDADTARALAAYKGRDLKLDGLTSLDAETAAALAGLGPACELLSLNGLTTLDGKTAAALARFEGYVSVTGLTTLGADAARALAGRKRWTGHLGSLTTLDAEAADVLAHFDRGVTLAFDKLGDTMPLTAQIARVVAASKSNAFNGSLPSLTAFESPDSVAVAEALAARKGPLSLPNLKKISPKTLSALLEKEDVDIPLIETLELIPEPDGSPTEDFVIPEGFQQRQQR